MRKIWMAAVIGSLAIVSVSVVAFNQWTARLPVTDLPQQGFRIIKFSGELAFDQATNPYPKASQIHLYKADEPDGSQRDLGALSIDQKALIDRDFYKQTRYIQVRESLAAEEPAMLDPVYELRYFDDQGRQVGSIELSYCIPYAGFKPAMKHMIADFPAIEKIMSQHGVIVDPHCGLNYDVHPPV